MRVNLFDKDGYLFALVQGVFFDMHVNQIAADDAPLRHQL